MRRAAGSGELRRLAVVLIGEARAQAAPAPDAPDLGALRRASAPYGGRVEPFEGGTTAIVLEAERQVATDHAVAAARCALVAAGLAGRRRVALAMGKAASTSRRPAQDTIERAARLLSHPGAGGDAGDEPPSIAIDEVVAGLLDARFDIIEHEAGVRAARRALAGGRRADAAGPSDDLRRARLGAAGAGGAPRRMRRRAARAGRRGPRAGRSGQVPARRRAREPCPAAPPVRWRSGSGAATRCARAPRSTSWPRRCAMGSGSWGASPRPSAVRGSRRGSPSASRRASRSA